MPYNETTRPFGDMSDSDRLSAIFTFKPIASVRHLGLLHDVPGDARYTYPPLLQFLIVMAARVFGSQDAALKALLAPGVWERCCDQYRALVKKGVNIPSKPPSAAVQDKYVRRLVGYDGVRKPGHDEQANEVPIDWDNDSDPLALLASQFTQVSLGQAIRQGQFPEDAGLPDFANPDPRCSVFGDGTWVLPYSKVAPVWDPLTESWVYSGTRADKGRPRVQDVCRRYGTVDGKRVVGINNVFIGTWTDAGRVMLSVRQTIRGESLAAISMIEDLIERLGDRLHTAVWDKALAGRVEHRIMALYAVLILCKPVARASNQRTSDGHTAREMKAEEAIAAHKDGRSLPLGTTVQWVSGERTMIRSKFHRYARVCCTDR